MVSHWFKELWRQQGFGYTALGTVSLIPRSVQVNWPISISFEQLLDEFVPPAELDKTVLNLGANDGKRHDPSYSLLAHRAYGERRREFQSLIQVGPRTWRTPPSG